MEQIHRLLTSNAILLEALTNIFVISGSESGAFVIAKDAIEKANDALRDRGVDAAAEPHAT